MNEKLHSIPWDVKQKGQSKYVLQLFVSCNSVNADRVMVNVRRVCKQPLKKRYGLEVMDLVHSQERTSTAEMVAWPTVVTSSSGRLRHFVGDLSNIKRLLYSTDHHVSTERP
ncbi:MAG: circadian clock KaiB family protein [Flavobacteriales bacterium]